MEKEAMFWKKIGKQIQCQLCPHFCFLNENDVGRCNARKNIKGKLISLVYARPCSIAIDPIEKKPLYHFLPGEKALSIATAGCNLRCGHCQNWQISQCPAYKIKSLELSPGSIVKEAKDNKCKIIAYTYTEPTIFYEYMLDIAKLAKKARIKNVTVTNGFINPEPLQELCNWIDASNIDIKSINDDFYQQVCGAGLEPISNAIKIMHEKGIWIELTNLIIPGLNDSLDDISKLVDWIKKNLGLEVPVHFSAFYPNYKLTHLPSTPASTLRKARNIAMNKGLHYVYTGNINDDEGNNTYCHKCKELLIKRKGFDVVENKLKQGKCFQCGEKIAGVWK